MPLFELTNEGIIKLQSKGEQAPRTLKLLGGSGGQFGDNFGKESVSNTSPVNFNDNIFGTNYGPTSKIVPDNLVYQDGAKVKPLTFTYSHWIRVL